MRTENRRTADGCGPDRRVLGRILGLAAAALLASLPFAAEGAFSEARLIRAADGTVLVHANGQAFHRTASAVRDLRTVPVGDGAVRLYLWEEEAGGGRRSFYAVAEGDGLLRGRVRETAHRVRLQGRSFDPVAEGEPEVSLELSARNASNLFLVQLAATPLPEMREAIEAQGGAILRFLTDHTFLVEMAPGARAAIGQLPWVRWIGSYHPLYRLEPVLQDALEGRAPRLETQRYSIMLGRRGGDRQASLAGRVESVGGVVDLVEPAGLRLEATLTHDQLLEVAHANEVQFIDRWGGPGETDTDIVRIMGGADYIEGLEGWTGQGVRGEIFDTELRTSHQEWPTAPIIHSAGTSGGSHGTACYSINFAQGTTAQARGLVPDGQGIFFRYNESTQFGGGTSRYTINQELLDPAGPYRAVFQTSSVGSSRTTLYTTISAEVDDYLFLHPVLSTQSQSNAGNQSSRPQAWAKNIVAVGGVRHLDNTDRCDDFWSGASIGPAADGRVKPDLSFFYDTIFTAWTASDSDYTQFCCTSAATPQTAGHFGLLFQMWHEGVWAGHGGGTDPFDSRPQMATAKALMVNHAYRYDWTNPGACSYGNVDRFKQGWGMPDLARLYDEATSTTVVDETDLIEPMGTNIYTATVAAGAPELAVTLVYTDPMGTVGASEARINDLSLRVTAPGGATTYWGNNGLSSGNFSTSGGVSNTVDTVENVFIANPIPGTWTIEVLGDEIVQDSHTETAALDADYALVVRGAAGDPIFTDGFETGDTSLWTLEATEPDP